jgi:hypothetical protein
VVEQQLSEDGLASDETAGHDVDVPVDREGGYERPFARVSNVVAGSSHDNTQGLTEEQDSDPEYRPQGRALAVSLKISETP